MTDTAPEPHSNIRVKMLSTAMVKSISLPNIEKEKGCIVVMKLSDTSYIDVASSLRLRMNTHRNIVAKKATMDVMRIITRSNR